MGEALASVLGCAPSGASPLAPRGAQPIQKLSYTHEAMIDLIIANPAISQNELALTFGYSAPWISTIISSDAFQAKLSERAKEFRDPQILQSLELQFKGLLARSMEILRHKLSGDPDKIPDQLVLQTARMSGTALGMGEAKTRVSITETHVHLEEHGKNLVSLLRRSRVVAEQDPMISEQGGQTNGV